MWQYFTVGFVFASVLTFVVTDIARAIVDSRRRKRYGAGGTQDIAIAGTIIGYLCLLGAMICGSLWILL